jgi:hypothetical protein
MMSPTPAVPGWAPSSPVLKHAASKMLVLAGGKSILVPLLGQGHLSPSFKDQSLRVMTTLLPVYHEPMSVEHYILLMGLTVPLPQYSPLHRLVPPPWKYTDLDVRQHTTCSALHRLSYQGLHMELRPRPMRSAIRSRRSLQACCSPQGLVV